MTELPPPVPEIPVSDLAAAANYYRDQFGFDIDWIATDIALAGISRDQCRLFLAGPSFRSVSGSMSPAVTWLNLESIGAVDELFAAWRSAGATMLSSPESKPFGLHEFVAADPDGNRFRVFHDFLTPQREAAAESPPTIE